ncbi:hypothetical protein B0J11DRAFT_494113, partial [Dendryphion nanum]
MIRATNLQVLYDQTKWLIDENASDSGSDSEGSSDEGQSTQVEIILEDIKMYTQCLVDLNIALECPAVDPDFVERGIHIDRLETRNAHDYYSDLIVAKYPEANIDLVECLGKANWERFQRMQIERANNLQSYKPIVATFEQSAVSKSEFRDSGLGTSVPAQTSTYAQTIISFMTSLSGGKHLQIPPIPLEGKNGQPFECLACGRDVLVQTNREWRKHLFNDLQPYSCFYPSCTFSSIPFLNRQTWSAHLELEHEFGPDWMSKTCPLCQSATGSGKSTILVHFSRHMEDCSLSALPRGIYSENNSETDSKYTSDDESHISATADEISKQGEIALSGAALKCVCNNTDIMVAVITCPQCLTVQHVDCYYGPGNVERKTIRDHTHMCVDCDPRKIPFTQHKRFSGERYMGQHAIQNSSHGYDQQILSKIELEQPLKTAASSSRVVDHLDDLAQPKSLLYPDPPQTSQSVYQDNLREVMSNNLSHTKGLLKSPIIHQPVYSDPQASNPKEPQHPHDPSDLIVCHPCKSVHESEFCNAQRPCSICEHRGIVCHDKSPNFLGHSPFRCTECDLDFKSQKSLES